MDNFNKTDADLSPTRDKTYHSRRISLNNWSEQELENYINEWAGKGFSIDSITPVKTNVVLIVFINNSRR